MATRAGLIAYSTQGSPVAFTSAALPQPTNAVAQWVNPRTGARVDAKCKKGADGMDVFTPPVAAVAQGNDWVLIVSPATDVNSEADTDASS